MNFFGDRLRALREQKGWNQVELAHYSKVSEHSISIYETGEREPTPRILTKLATALGVPRESLLGVKYPPSARPQVMRDLPADVVTTTLAALRTARLVGPAVPCAPAGTECQPYRISARFCSL